MTPTTPMTTESFLALAATANKETALVPLPHVGDAQHVRVRKLTFDDVRTFRRLSGARSEHLHEGYRFVVLRAVVDDAGVRLFNDEDGPKLVGMDYETLDLIATATLRFSGVIGAEPAHRVNEAAAV
ncbi:MAG TPA: hypothetical protein VF624_18815 [Tepidisphaeraceae bacterium]|jgi:hypothetical protein